MPPEEVEAQKYAMAHASLEELYEAIGDLKAEWRSKAESRASASDMRRAMDKTAAVICARVLVP
jgi:predicted RNase H-like nuclease